MPHWKNYPTALFLTEDFSENSRNIRNYEEIKGQPKNFFWTTFSPFFWSTSLLSRIPICNPGRKLMRLQGLELWLTSPTINSPSVQSLVAKSSISVTGFWVLEGCFQNWTQINFTYQEKKDKVTTKPDTLLFFLGSDKLKKSEKKPSIFRFHSQYCLQFVWHFSPSPDYRLQATPGKEMQFRVCSCSLDTMKKVLTNSTTRALLHHKVLICSPSLTLWHAETWCQSARLEAYLGGRVQFANDKYCWCYTHGLWSCQCTT